MTSRSPDLHLKALNKVTGQHSGRLGVAWRNANGSISLRLEMFVTLPSSPEVIYTLFPADEAESKPSKKKATMADSPVSSVHHISPFPGPQA